MVKARTEKVSSKKRQISFDFVRPKSSLLSREEQISIPAAALSGQAKQQLPLTGRLPYFIKNWLNITQISAILKIVQGFQIQFQSFPVQKTLPRPSLQNCKLVNEEIETLFQKGAIKPAPFNDQAFYHRMFLVAKKGGSQRPVLDLSPLNKFINGTFQDGESHDNKVPHKQEGLHDKYRSYGRLSHRANTPKLTPVPSLPMARTVLPIRNNAIWPERSTTSIHKINEARKSLATRSGCSNDYFFRRHTCSRSNNRYIKPTRT